jgi:regulator of replication initiation timing
MTKPGDSQTKKTLHELAKEFPDKTYRELEKYREKDRQQEAGTCIMGEMRKDREETFEPSLETQIEALKKELDLERECSQAGYLENKKLIKRVQEAEGELSIVKTITIDSSPEMREAKKEIKNLKWIKDQDYIFLVDENKRLRAELKKLKEGTVDRARKAGL